MARIDWTRILVAAPGLRPTASEAFMPINPTPSAAPSAANPTCRFPLISATIGINDIYDFLSLAQRLPRLNTVKPLKSILSMLPGPMSLVLANQHGKHRRQQHEHQCLNKTHQ